MKKISIIVPVYNEEGNVLDAYSALSQIAESLKDKYRFEILFTDNHSQDKTFSILQSLAKNDPRLKVVRFSKNFGYQKSIYTGYLLSSGDAVVQFDCDMQDPPEMIPKFIEKWEEGYVVVYGIRKKREEIFLMNIIRKIFYRIISYLSDDNLPRDAGEFRLIDKKMIDEFRKLYDYSPYIRGLIASFGFDQIGIPYDRLKRKKGKSKFKLSDLISLSIDGIINHSSTPLRLSTYCGFIIFLFAFFLLFFYMIAKLFFGQSWPRGFTTIIILILLSLGLNASFLGIMGEYIARIYQQVKRRPITLIDKTINFNDKNYFLKQTENQ